VGKILVMRIAFLCPHLRVGGGVRAVLGYADRLAARGHSVSVVVPAGGPISAAWRAVSRRRPEWMPGFGASIRWTSRWRADALPDGDALVATAWQSAPVVAAAPDRCGRKFYLVQHYESLYHGPRAIVDATYRLPLSKIAISTWLAGIMREKFGQPCEVLVTPVDLDLFHPTEVGDLDRVLMLHHDYQWKGVADGLAAVARVRSRHPSVKLVGFGRKAPRGRLPSSPDGARLPYDEFHADPPQAALPQLYSRCGIYLCPSWDEGLGMPSMEAMACGAALCTYDNGGCREYARSGETALVARRRDVADLADQLLRLLTDAPLREKIAAAGTAFVRREFDWERAVARLEALLAC
jgi:glycosyltransferase involved in cell wall biosynthesis